MRQFGTPCADLKVMNADNWNETTQVRDTKALAAERRSTEAAENDKLYREVLTREGWNIAYTVGGWSATKSDFAA